jgi:hypothetical protein
MKMSLKSLAITAGLLWSGAILLSGLIHVAVPSYATAFLEGISSLYPGFHAARNVPDAIVGGIYAFFDAAIGGLVFGWLYNLFSGRPAHT